MSENSCSEDVFGISICGYMRLDYYEEACRFLYIPLKKLDTDTYGVCLQVG